MRANFFWQIWYVAKKDILLEWQGQNRLHALIFFGMLTLLLFSFAIGPQAMLLARVAPGFLWLAILLASTLSMGESMRLEHDNHALDGLLLLAIYPAAIFLGKAIANVLFLVCLSMVLVPVATALYGSTMVLGLPLLLLVLFLGVAAISAPGMLYAAIAATVRSRDVLLPLLLFPILIPGLLASVKATTLVMQGDPMGELTSWLMLLVLFNMLYWLLCTLLFGKVVDP